MKRRIVTEYVPHGDWSATLDGHGNWSATLDGHEHPIGHGPTEREAIIDLEEQLDE